jgi:prepilin-type N-terminal cleavage/methylation domain-containing protein
MRPRDAFTLLELIVSITVAGIIALLAYGSASAGFDTRDAIARHRATAEADVRFRALLADVMRHASDEADAGQVAFDLLDAVDQRGVPSDRVSLLTRGMLPPLGASALWTVTLSPGPNGLELRAAPVGASHGPPIIARLEHARGLDVQVMSLADRAWTAGWGSPAQLPAAVQLTLYDSAGAPVGAPVVVRVGLESLR